MKIDMSQGEHIEKVLERLKMQNGKPISTHFANHFKPIKEMCPKTHEEIEYMSKFPYSSAFCNLMYVTVCTRPYIVHAMGFVSRYMNNQGKENWKAM